MPRKYTPQNNLTGQGFGRLTVIAPANVVVRWMCQCECGNITYATTAHLLRDGHQSCGCLVTDRNVELNTTHGMSYDPAYSLHANMVYRCSNPKAPNYERYGGRGIDVCERWQTFEFWYEDIGQFRPSSDYSLDRKDNDGGYWCGTCSECVSLERPLNCKWETATGQARNKSTTVRLTLEGQTKTAYEWAEVTGLPVSTILQRIRQEWPDAETLTTPHMADGQSRKDRLITFKDQSLRLGQWSKIAGIPKNTLDYRLKAGWSVEAALTTPPSHRNRNPDARQNLRKSLI